MSNAQMEQQIQALLEKMTPAEKVNMCHAVTTFTSGGVPRLGIPPLSMSDGPHGVREEIAADSWDAVGGDQDCATYLPTGTALAATWSRECARLFGEVLGSEARDRGKDVILGPGVNMVRSPLCGRNFEYYGEDPYQAGELAAESIQGIQSQGTAACVKHFALNSQELRRHDVNATCSERALRELYLPAFESAVIRGGAMTLMGAYNRFRGQKCCQNDYLLNQILKKEWGFDGVVISDWAGVTDTFEAARNGMDIEMGTGEEYCNYHLADPFLRAVENGEIEMAVLDDKVRRILRLMFRLGMIGDGNPRPAGERNTPAHQAAARAIASEAITLLKNETSLLPLDAGKIRKLLVVGDNADCRHHFGGHSSAVKALYEVTPLEGLKNLLAGTEVEIRSFRGYPAGNNAGKPVPSSLMEIVDAGAGTRGWICEIYDNHHRSGVPVRTLPVESPEFDPEKDLPEELRGKDFGVLFKGVLTPKKSEAWTFFLDGCSQACLGCEGVNFVENCKSEQNVCGSATVMLEAGHSYKMEIPIVLHVGMPVYPVRLTAVPGGVSAAEVKDEELFAAAREADAVLFFGGLNHTFDAEGSDRKDMALHDGQNELISALAKINPRLAVVLVGGSPVEMPWIDEVPAVVQMWYAGMEAGNAIADVLFGRVNPSGKLPFTFPKRLADSPAHALNDYQPLICHYAEDLLMGYRWFDTKGIEPLFPFGHGLSYTSFEYGEPVVETDGDAVVVRMKITNTGSRAGRETVQLYIAPPESEFQRPVQELKGFEKVALEPGESREAEFRLNARSFAIYHPEKREWFVVPGRYRLRFGASSRDIRREAVVER